jgi:hypothetical protein
VANTGAPAGGLRARALFDYQATDQDEVTFDPDEIIEDIEKVCDRKKANLILN